MNSSRTQAIVLRRTNYGEADRILQLLTPEGRKSVMARGVRKEKSKLAGGIELLAISDVVVTSGRGELGILTSARLIHFYRHIMKDYDRLQFAYEAMKQVTRASESIDEAQWFEVLKEIFMGLDVLKVPLELVEIWFYMQLTELLGDELNLRTDIAGSLLVESETYSYDGNEKTFRVNGNGDIQGDHIKFMRLAQKKPLTSLVHIGGLKPILPQCLYVVRQHAAL